MKRPPAQILADARDMLAKAEAVPNGQNHYPNWDDETVADVLGPLLEYVDALEASRAEWNRIATTQADAFSEQLRASMRNFADTIAMALDASPKEGRRMLADLRDHLRRIADGAN